MDQIEIYKTKDNQAIVEVKFENDTVWLSQIQIAKIFEVQRPAITKHLANMFKSGEVIEDSVSSILEHTAKDKKKYKTKFYNLDAIISIGYRINSQRATQFRQWATQRLKDHLLYFVIKNHPFSDGNKRIGAFLFIWFLEKNKHRFKKSGELKINDNALTAIALLVAQSNPMDKELMVALIINLIKNQ